MAPNARHVGFTVRHFVHNYMHNSKTKGRTRMFYLHVHVSNDRVVLYVRYSRRVMDPNTYRNTLRYVVLCVLTLVTRKLQVVCRRSTYRRTALLSQMSIYCVRAGFEIQMASYASKHASKSLSDKPLLHIQCSCVYIPFLFLYFSGPSLLGSKLVMRYSSTSYSNFNNTIDD